MNAPFGLRHRDFEYADGSATGAKELVHLFSRHLLKVFCYRKVSTVCKYGIVNKVIQMIIEPFEVHRLVEGNGLRERSGWCQPVDNGVVKQHQRERVSG